MADEKFPEFPNNDDRSFGYHVAQTSLGAADIVIPGAGYALQQIVAHVVGEPLTKRREEWFRLVGTAIIELQGKVEGFDPSSLSENEEFVSCVYEATHLAMKTHRQYKRQALKNAITNTALGFSLDETLRGRFFSCVDQFSQAHSRLLAVLSDPGQFETCRVTAKSMFSGSLRHVVRAEISETEMPDVVFNNVVADLERERFITGSLSGMMSGGDSMLVKRTTENGDLFLRFIGNEDSER